jgi:hypothetical protein
MARGWESKAVESQQAGREQSPPSSNSMAPDELQRRAERRTLELARARATGDLARATAPAHREMLERAIAALDERLRALGANG